ncbi:MAG: hypothetical protein H0T15_05715, partial [Thermoleophilaceae bacterium]|nr:hypothetical protein [Thermoleophilaceae bacterium]
DLDAEACRSLPNPEDGPDAFGIDWQNAEDPSIGDRIRSVFEGRFGDLWKRR